MAPKAMIDIVLHNRTRNLDYGESFFRRICDAAAPYLGTPRGRRAEVGISLIGPVAMRSLNRKYRKVDKSTDVLSFPLHMRPITGYTAISLGDLFISPRDVAAKAADTGKTVREQMAWTVVHGLLHLAGHDHELGPARARKMFALESKILKLL